MNFIAYNLLLLLACIPALLILSSALIVPLSPLLLFAKSKNPPSKVLVFSLRILAGILLAYFSANWAAFCVTMAIKYANKPEVTWGWLYFVAAFVWCLSLARFWSKASIEALFRDEPTPLQSATVSSFKFSVYHIAYLAQSVSIVAYIGFAIFPKLMRVPYVWISILLS